MSRISGPTSLGEIQRIAQQVAERFQPQKIILFGSYAYGEPTEDSDVDLLVVMETTEPALHVAARISAAVEHPFPLDILVRTPSELEAAFERKGIFAVEVATKGVVLYEA
jgi:predicted nucleotidyltransferase